MNRVRQFGIVILVILPVTILVLIRATTADRFKPDARRLAEPAFSHTNTRSRGQLAAFTSGYLIIDLSDQVSQLVKQPGDSIIQLASQLLLEKTGQQVLRSHDIPVLLYSSEPAVSARIWMVLNQMGYRDLYILTEEPDNEVMKYKFRPDTTAAAPVI